MSRLHEWLCSHAGLVPPLSVERAPGGLSNVTLMVTDRAGQQLVLRRPPYGAREGGAHQVLREARLMAAVAPFGVPVPGVITTCANEEVDGAPFYAMELVDGVVVDTVAVLADLDPNARVRLSYDLVDLLATVQAVDLDAAGLADLRRPRPYLERTLRRWRSQWDAIGTRDLPALERVAARLEVVSSRLVPLPDVLVHGDFRFGNVMIGRGPDPAIEALLDWELATVGHPLADLGFLAARLNAGAEVLPRGCDPLGAPGCADFDQLVGRFQERTGIDTSDLSVFMALAAWRWAIIAEGVYVRLRDDRMGETGEDVAWHARRSERLAELALEWVP